MGMKDAQMAEDWIVPLTISSQEREFIPVWIVSVVNDESNDREINHFWKAVVDALAFL